MAEVRVLAARERQATARLIAALAELDSRRLYLGEGFSSLFKFCTERLHLAEHAAYNRIEAARAARRWPIILEMLADGRVTVTAVRLLAPHMTDENHRVVLDAAVHRTRREVEQQIAALRPLPPVPSIVRKLPAPTSTVTEARQVTTPPVAPCTQPVRDDPAPGSRAALATPVPPRPAIVTPLAPERYKIQITVSRETHDKLRRVQDLLRHQIPNADPAIIFDRALSLLLDDLEKKKLAQAKHPQTPVESKPGSRHVPAAVKRQVWARDAGQCAFVGAAGRCAERGFLEFHHLVPFADGGPTTSDNLQLRCRPHNACEAKRHFGLLLLRNGQSNTARPETSCAFGAQGRPVGST